MVSVAEHYDRHLASFYAWAAGGQEQAERRAERELVELNVARERAGTVLDLGAGFGPHALAFARLGHHVTAVDASSELLDQLACRRGGLSLQIEHADLVEHVEAASAHYDIVLCLGDTLTHLATEHDVRRLLHAAVARLAPGGQLALTFRDYSRMDPGERRFILVRATDKRIATCILEGEVGRVVVHDLLHECSAEGWELTASFYQKLQLDPGLVISELEALGCSVSQRRTDSGMIAIVASLGRAH